MPPNIEVNDVELMAAFNRVLAAGVNLRPVLDAIGGALANTTRLRFISGEGPTGAPWAPLSAVTIALRRKGGKGAQPLRDTERLKNSISHHVGTNYVEVGTNVIYARMQQMGAAQGAFGRTRRNSPIPWGRVPPRPFLGLSNEDRAEVLDIFHQAIRGAAEGR